MNPLNANMRGQEACLEPLAEPNISVLVPDSRKWSIVPSAIVLRDDHVLHHASVLQELKYNLDIAGVRRVLWVPTHDDEKVADHEIRISALEVRVWKGENMDEFERLLNVHKTCWGVHLRTKTIRKKADGHPVLHVASAQSASLSANVLPV